MRKGSRLPYTSRVTEKIIEYYTKFGQERDLEKYMRIYSPPPGQSAHESRSRSATLSSSHSEEEGRIFRQLFQQDMEVTAESHSEAKEIIVPIEMHSEKGLPVNTMKPKGGDECTSSAPDLHTPPPRNKLATDTKETQTPESVAKTHRRLEWDSLADIGYRKSLSTSNISILERSVLREYFQEISSGSGAKKEKRDSENKTRSNLDSLKKIGKSNETTKDHHQPNQNTPPLASSTMMDTKPVKENISTRSRPKLVSKSTSMSLQKRYDQGAQTSIQRMPQCTSREVQVALSSATSVTSSNAAGTATPSSFDYYSNTRSTISTTTDGDVFPPKKLSHTKKHVNNTTKSKEDPETEHPFVAGINEMLMTRKTLDAENNENSKKDMHSTLQEVHDTLKQVLNENKENTASSTASILNSPQLDLGIQLLCSLIDARSLSQKQKKKLVRDIVKRISTLNTYDDDRDIASERNCDVMSNADLVSVCPSLRIEHRALQQNVEGSIKSTSTVKMARTGKTSMDMSDLARDLPSSTVGSKEVNEQLLAVNAFKKPPPPTTSAQATVKCAEVKAKSSQNVNQFIGTGTTEKRDAAGIRNAKGELNQVNVETKNDEQHKVVNNSDKDSSASKASTTSKEVTTQRVLINLENVGTGSSDTTSDVVAAHSAMREWLNPMTQSEIEYEQKKLEDTRNASQRNKLGRCLNNNDNLDTERRTQLKWIQTEIERLEILRSLLTKTNSGLGNGTEHTVVQNAEREPSLEEIENLYDTVFSEDTKQRNSVRTNSSTTTTTTNTTSRAHSNSTDDSSKQLQEIEVIIEESHEDVVELNEKLKRSRQRKRETQIIYDKPKEKQNNNNNNSNNNNKMAATGKACFRTMTETVTTNEEQVLPPTTVMPVETPMSTITHRKQLSAQNQRPRAQPQPQQQQQRSKIDTPPSCDSGKNERNNDDDDAAIPESVSSFAKQRKREFLEQYRHRKSVHYESLLQQQQQFLIKQQQQIIKELQQRCNAIAQQVIPANNATSHYCIPQNMPPRSGGYCGCAAQQLQQQQQQVYRRTNIQQQTHNEALGTRRPNENGFNVPIHAPAAPFYQPLATRVQTHTTADADAAATTAANYSHTTQIQTTHSEQSTSSSVFCISSEVSIPTMGTTSSGTRSTTTTIDDNVAAAVCGITGNGIAVQTGASLRRTQPIFGNRRSSTAAYDCTERAQVLQWATYNPQPTQQNNNAQSSCVQVKPKAIAYVIQFDKKTRTTTTSTTITTTNTTVNSSNSTTKIPFNYPGGSSGIGSSNNGDSKELWSMKDDNAKTYALQDYLERAKPKFVAHTKERKAILNQIQALRLERGRELRDIIENASDNSLDMRLQRLPPPATKRLRIFATKEMKAMTQRHYKNLPEVIKRQERAKEERQRHGNRLIRDIFNQRLQRRVRNGQLSLNHSRTVI